jgi:hypothetical protein
VGVGRRGDTSVSSSGLGTVKGWLSCCLRLDYACENRLLNLSLKCGFSYLLLKGLTTMYK